MSFKDYFPVTIWLGKRLSSGTPRWILLSILVLFLGLNLLFRASAAFSGHHMGEIARSLSLITVGKTTDQEVLRLVSSAHSRLLSDLPCSAEECINFEVADWDRPVLWLRSATRRSTTWHISWATVRINSRLSFDFRRIYS